MVARGVSRPRFSQGRDLFYFSPQVDLLGSAERVIDLDAEVTDRAFEFGVSDEKLNYARGCPSSCRSGPSSSASLSGRPMRSYQAGRSRPKHGGPAHTVVSKGAAAPGSGTAARRGSPSRSRQVIRIPTAAASQYVTNVLAGAHPRAPLRPCQSS